ncbi:MAG: barstar family protein [Xanthomonadales bacterium]|nr:barstar family protein [Xanthomonadales bacterium]
MSRNAPPTLLQDTLSGVHFVEAAMLPRILAPAAGRGLHVARVDLGGCTGKQDLLTRIALALHFPESFGHNWDALADSLGDLSWLPGQGVVLVLERAAGLMDSGGDIFPILLEILGGVAADAAAQGWRWHAVIAIGA